MRHAKIVTSTYRQLQRGTLACLSRTHTYLSQEVARPVEDRRLPRVAVDALHVTVQLHDTCNSIEITQLIWKSTNRVHGRALCGWLCGLGNIKRKKSLKTQKMNSIQKNILAERTLTMLHMLHEGKIAVSVSMTAATYIQSGCPLDDMSQICLGGPCVHL